MKFLHSLSVRMHSKAHSQQEVLLHVRKVVTVIKISMVISMFGLISHTSAFSNVPLKPDLMHQPLVAILESSSLNIVAETTVSAPLSNNIDINDIPIHPKADDKLRIISLAPHLTEIVFALGLGEHLVAVSDYSDYPAQAASLPSVSSYQGTNNAEVLRLAPSHVLAWKGGNKQQDIDKLQALGLNLHASSPSTINDLAEHIYQIATFLGVAHQGKKITLRIEKELSSLRKMSNDASIVDAAYLMNIVPLSGAGKDAWINSILDLCAINNIYRDGVSSYLQISMANLIRQQLPLIILASNSEANELHTVLAPHSKVYQPKLIQVNPDTLHRFTPRVIADIKTLCKQARSSK